MKGDFWKSRYFSLEIILPSVLLLAYYFPFLYSAADFSYPQYDSPFSFAFFILGIASINALCLSFLFKLEYGFLFLLFYQVVLLYPFRYIMNLYDVTNSFYENGIFYKHSIVFFDDLKTAMKVFIRNTKYSSSDYKLEKLLTLFFYILISAIPFFLARIIKKNWGKLQKQAQENR